MGVMQGTDKTSSTPASGNNNTYNSDFKGPYSSCTDNGGTDNCNSNTFNTTGKEWPSSKYYDLYDYRTTDQQYQRGILGDATKEVGPFYSANWPKTDGTYVARQISSYNADLTHFVMSGFPWFLRGGAHPDGTDAGVFAFLSHYGNMGINLSFRIVLTP